ncbi:Rv1733c family protein [Streptomyces sp. NPDC003011]
MRIRVRGWRWRRNPLRRRSDVVEAWTVLAVAVLLAVGAPLAGAVAGRWAHDEARAVAVEQRADRQRVRAEVVGRTSDALPSVGGREHTYRVAVRWAEPGGEPRTATTRVPAGTQRGDTLDVWFDSRGRSVAPPPDGTAVWRHAVGIGAFATGSAVAVVLLAHAVVRSTADRRRMAEWERDWALTEPQWTRRRA